MARCPSEPKKQAKTTGQAADGTTGSAATTGSANAAAIIGAAKGSAIVCPVSGNAAKVKAAIKVSLESFVGHGIEIIEICETRDQVINEMSERKFKVTVDGQAYEVSVSETTAKSSHAKPAREIPDLPPVASGGLKKPDSMKVPIAGSVREIFVKVGDTVRKGDVVMILEAMKMYNKLEATKDGKIAEIKVKPSDKVLPGDVLLVYEKQ
jgi:glutaconyl-CoA/methylmalonyl-CoA decarboxylase subunit gamma